MAGGAHLDSDDSDEMITQINVVPLVDIILVVLIIFMVTANMIAKQSIELDLPEASTGEATEPTTLGLTLDAENNLFLNGSPVSYPELKNAIAEALLNDKKTQAVIAADQTIAHGKVLQLVDFIRRNGLSRFAFNIEPVSAATADAAAGVEPKTSP